MKNNFSKLTEKSLNALAGLIFEKIKHPNIQRKIVFFIGAGSSRSSGIKLADELTSYLLKERYGIAGQKVLKEDLKNEFPDKHQNPTLEMVCSIIAKHYGPDEINRFIEDNFPKIPKRPISMTYEILAHLINHNIVDCVVTMNFDELLEWALNDEIGIGGYVRAVAWEDFVMLKREHLIWKKPVVFKPHGTVSIRESMIWEIEQVDRLHRIKREVIAEVLKDSHIIFIGYSFRDPDIQRLLLEVSENYEKRIFVVTPNTPNNQTMSILQNFNSSQNIINQESDKFFQNLLEKINDCIDIEIKAKRFYKITRHQIRKHFLDKKIMRDTITNRLLLELIIYGVKARGEFTGKDLTKCQRIINLLDLLERNRLSPKEVLDQLAGENGVFNCLESPIGTVYEFRSLDTLIRSIPRIYGTEERIVKDEKDNIVELFTQLKETFDVDIYVDPTLRFEFKNPEVIRNHFNFIRCTRNIITKAKKYLCCISETAEWLYRDEHQDVLSKKLNGFQINIITANRKDLDKQRGKSESLHYDRRLDVSEKLNEEYGAALNTVDIPWYTHNEHLTLNDQGMGIYFARDAKCPIICPIFVDDTSDYKRIKEKFVKYWEDTGKDLPRYLSE